MQHRRFAFAALALSTTLSLTAAPTTASACGGTFCSNSPITQNAERVLFIRRGEGDTTAVVQIQAQGNDPDFAWVVPLESMPRDIHEEPTTTFLGLDQSTAPTYLFFNRASFTSGSGGGGFGCGAADSAATAGAAPESDNAVRVWASGETGNYRYDVVSSEDPAALRRWLDDNRYRTPVEAEPIIAEYVSEHKLFLAVRLRAVQGVPSFLVTPLAFTYAGRAPCVPIRLTRIATVPSLPVLTYVVSDRRAIPMNFSQTTVADVDVARLGPTRFNTQSYDQLVANAVNEAGGRAWVTEFAGDLPEQARSLFSPELQALLPARPYLTRLYTTIPADRMDRDPEFMFVTGLPDVSNQHDLSGYPATASALDPRWLLGASAGVGLLRAAWRRRKRAA